MIVEPHAPDNTLLGLKILFMLGGPVLIIYWIHSVITPKTPPVKIIPKQQPLTLHKFRPKTLKYCESHLTNIPKGRIALVVDQSRCGLCKKGT